MKKNIYIFITAVFSFYSLSFSPVLKKETQHTIIGNWIWVKSTSLDENYVSTPKINGHSRKIAFTEDNQVIIYKNNIEIRINKYFISKGISVYDNQEHDLITFEGITYLIEKLDKHNLILTNNSNPRYRSVYKK